MASLLSRFTPSSRALCWTALISWCAVIFAFSAQPNLTIVEHHLLDLVVRKLGHMTVFGILLVLASMTARQESIPSPRAELLALLGTVCFAASDEWHQTFVTGRVGSPIDVGIDALGAILALLLLRRWETRS